MSNVFSKISLIALILALVFAFSSCELLFGADENKDPTGDSSQNDSTGDTDGEEPDDSDGEEHTHAYEVKNTDSKYLVSSATCTKGAVYHYSCACGEAGDGTFTHGEPIAHDWEEATCTSPKTCRVCDTRSGAVLPHSWMEATCEHPATCSGCGKTYGGLAEHKYDGISCTVCGKTIGDDDGIELPIIPLD